MSTRVQKLVVGGNMNPPLPPRERILLAAQELFYAHGLHAIGVETIAEAAGTNKMTLYRHYKSKDDLIVAYVSALAAEGEAVWIRIATEHPRDAGKRLEGWLTYVDDVLMTGTARGCALANAAVELAAGHPARTVIEGYKQRKREHIVKLFRDAGFRAPEGLADEVFLLFEGARVSMQCGGKGVAQRLSRMLRDLIGSAPRAKRAAK